MAELRQNMATKEWVIIATERSKRPHSYAEPRQHITTDTRPLQDPTCPFCPGNEELDLEIDRWPTTGPWQVRTVHNRYPALSKTEVLSRTYDRERRRIAGVGHHEIMIEHTHHNTTPALMSVTEIEAVMEMYYSRGWDIRNDARIKQIIYFKNHGPSAGASLPHPHNQIIGLPVVPTHTRQRTEEARRFFDDTGECVFCVMMAAEQEREACLVSLSEHFLAFVLYAAPSPFYLWIVPRRHSVSYLYTNPEERADLAKILKDVLIRLFVGLRDPAYNLIIHSAPVQEMGNDYLHWYVAVIPRLSYTAGFELGSGMYINPTLPEECAAFLREVHT